MQKREELNRLVVGMLKSRPDQPTAREIYETIRVESNSSLRDERVKSFRSFVKIINSFDGVRAVSGIGINHYTIKRFK